MMTYRCLHSASRLTIESPNPQQLVEMQIIGRDGAYASEPQARWRLGRRQAFADKIWIMGDPSFLSTCRINFLDKDLKSRRIYDPIISQKVRLSNDKRWYTRRIAL